MYKILEDDKELDNLIKYWKDLIENANHHLKNQSLLLLLNVETYVNQKFKLSRHQIEYF